MIFGKTNKNKIKFKKEKKKKAERSGFQGLLTVAGVRKEMASLIPGHS